MEVHHPHHAGHGKKWTGHLLEFFMLFLAVFLGFIAENIREKIVERHREKEYIRSFIEDLKADTTAIGSNIVSKKSKIANVEMLIGYLKNPNPNEYGTDIYYRTRQLTRSANFLATDRTIQQLKNSGGLRLIRNQAASDSISSYEQAVERIYITQNREEAELTNVREITGKLLDPLVLETMTNGPDIHPPAGNPPLRSTDKDLMLDFIYAVHQMKTSDALNMSRLELLKQKASGIIEFLRKAYHLK